MNSVLEVYTLYLTLFSETYSIFVYINTLASSSKEMFFGSFLKTIIKIILHNLDNGNCVMIVYCYICTTALYITNEFSYDVYYCSIYLDRYSVYLKAFEEVVITY